MRGPHAASEGDLRAIELPPTGLGDTYAPEILLPTLDRRLSSVGFDPPLVDTFALVTRAGSRLSRPVEDFVDRVTAHLRNRTAAARWRRLVAFVVAWFLRPRTAPVPGPITIQAQDCVTGGAPV